MNLLTADIGSTYTKLTAIDTIRKKIIATSAAFTTIETDVMEGLIAISALEDHFHVIRSMGKIAQDDMDESEE